MDRLPYVECYPNGRNGPQAGVCIEKEIKSYPTWFIGGQRIVKVLHPHRLAQLSDFKEPAR